MDLTQYDGIIFDMDGTLIDSMPKHSRAWQKTCAYFGYPFEKEYLWSLGGVPTKKIVTMLNKKFNLAHDPIEVANKKQQFVREDESIEPLIPVTSAIFQRYLNKKPIAVGTGSNRQYAEYLLSEHQLIDKLSALVTADDVKQGKPHPETFLTAAKKIQVAPEKCVVFEDTQIGVEAARAAGMDCILVENNQLRKLP